MFTQAQFLTKEEQHIIHNESIRILEEVGVLFHSKKALRILEKNGARVDKDSGIAKTTNVPEATVRYRLKKLIDGNFIQIVAAANPIKLGFGIVASINIEAETKLTDHVIEELEKIKRVAYIVQMTSFPNVVIETYIESINELHNLLSQIEQIDGIIRADTSFIRKIARERFDFGTPSQKPESESNAGNP